jgi:hypothetical protein
MKRLILILFAAAAISHAQTYYMNVWSKGKQTSIPVQNIQRITFSNIASSVGNTGNDKVTAMVSNFQLLQNYPNPFNPSTAIQYQIPNGGAVEVKIFSIKGELVKTFNKTYSGSGSYSVTWDGRNESGQAVASGLYLYCVSYGHSVMMRKMTFVK